MAKVYSVKEIHKTLQGEGAQAGRAAIFLRFSGCNLWSGLEKDRASAICQFCDTDFVGTNGENGGKYTADALAAKVADLWDEQSSSRANAYIVCTGGEPLLQLDENLIEAFKAHEFSVGVETNGTLGAPRGLDWICVSPKAQTSIQLTSGNECKLVFPQAGSDPAEYEALQFEHYFLQPMDGPDIEANTRAAVQYCLAHPQWRLSVQTHKWLGIA